VTEALGLPRFPIRYHRTVTVTFEYTLQMKGEPLVLDQNNLPTTSAIVCPPSADPARCPRVWHLAEDGSPFPRALKGCFWPRHLSAGRVVDWGMPYPAICVVHVLLPPRHFAGMAESAEDRFRLSNPNWNYREEFYGHDPALREWLLIGFFQYPSLPPEIQEQLRAEGYPELKSLAARHSLPVWDGSWLETFTGLKPRPLPEGWQNWPDFRTSGFSAKYPGKPISEVMAEWSR
jgi:hypothetical protein